MDQFFRQVELHVLPGNAEELLVGRPELERLSLPNLESVLEALAAARNEAAAPAQLDSKARASFELLAEIKLVDDGDLQIH